MKNTILLKVWGIVLTLAIIAGLLMATVPVSAGTNLWTSYPVPTFYPGSSANVYAFNGDGSVIYIFNNADHKLYKSTNGGGAFSNLNLDVAVASAANPLLGNLGNASGTISAIKVDPADDNILIATNGTSFYRSTNAGKLWNEFLPVVSGFVVGNITSIDIADASGAVYLVGSAGGVFAYDTSVGVWAAVGHKATTTPATSASYITDVVAVAFAPNDPTIIVAVTNVAGSTIYTLNNVINDGSVWNFNMPSAVLVNPVPAGVTPVPPAANGKVSIALPSNFDVISYKSYKAFIGISTSSVFRVVGTSSTATVVSDIIANSSNAPTVAGIASVSFNGTISSGTLVIGEQNGVQVLNSTNPYTAPASIVWNGLAGDIPTVYGVGTTVVKFKPGTTTLYVGTAGADSALFMNNTAAYDSFSGVGFYNCKALFAGVGFVPKQSFVGLGAANQTCVMYNGNGNALLLVSTDTGANWKLILNYLDIDGVKTFGTTWVLDSKGPAATTYDKYYLKSVDNGATWSKLLIASGAAGTGVTVFSPIDADTYWLGNSSGLRKNTTAVYTTIGVTSETPNTLIDFGAWMFVKTNSSHAYSSVDGGATWTLIGIANAAEFPGAPPSFDVPNKTIYQQFNGIIRSWVIGTSTAWTTELNMSALPGAMTSPSVGSTVNGASFQGKSPDGFWYFTSVDNNTPSVGQIWRSETLQDPTSFAPVLYTTAADMGGTLDPGPLTGVSDASGNSNYNVGVTLFTAPDFGYKAAKRALTYTLNAPPVVTSPVDKSSVGSPVDFKWNPVAYAGPVSYQLTVAYDAKMLTPVSNSNGTTTYNKLVVNSTLLPTQALLPGTYYMQIRSMIAVGGTTFNTFSKWSTPIMFSVKLQSVGTLNDPALTNRIFPDNGASNVNTTTPFTWGTVSAATSYEIDIATDPAFTSLVASATGLTGTSYTTKDPLKNATNYYWRVRATNGNGSSDWVTSAFTTAAITTATPGGTGTVTVPAVTPIITVNVPTQPVQPPQSVIVTVQGGNGTGGGTPAWAWIVIAIGAVLVIAVIVLIVRTRKV